jgi:hypothetical protein
MRCGPRLRVLEPNCIPTPLNPHIFFILTDDARCENKFVKEIFLLQHEKA